MDDIFNAQPELAPLDQLVPNTPTQPLLPERVARNEAAYIALMTQKPIENYQTMMAQNAQGSKDAMDTLQSEVSNAVSSDTMKTTLELLSRKDIPMEMKKQLFQGLSNKRPTDVKREYLNSSYIEPSAGETPEAERARYTIGNVMDTIHKEQNKRQLMLDSFAATRRDDVLAEFTAGAVLPFAESKMVASMSKPGAWSTLKAFLLPGSMVKNDQQKFEALTPEGKTEYLKDVLSRAEKGNLVGWGDAHLHQVDYVRAVTEGEDYLGTLGVIGMNIANFLDVVGLGFTVRGMRSVGKAARVAGEVPVPPVAPMAAGARPAGETVHPATWELVDEVPPTPKTPETGLVVPARDITPKPRQIEGTKALPSPVQKAVEVSDQIHRVEANSILKAENPASPLSSMMQTNPEKARSTLETIKQDTDGEFTKAMTGGNTPEQVLVDVMVPDIITPSGRVTAKPAGLIDVDASIKATYERAGATAFTATEKAAMNRGIEAAWRGAEGLTIHDGMGGFRISSDGNYASVSAVYGTPTGAFSLPERAIEQATFALRKQGVVADDIQLLVRDGMDYKPTTLAEVAGKEGNYLIRLENKRAYSLSDESLVLEPFTMKRTWADRNPVLSKMDITRHVFDPAAVMDPIIHQPIGVAVDKSVNLDRLFLKMADDFAKDVKLLPSTSKSKIMDYVYMADERAIAFDPIALRAQGWANEEIAAVGKWKKFWDNQYHFENEDLVQNLTREGYMKYVGNTGDEFIAKPVKGLARDIAIGVNDKAGRALDPATGSVDFITKTDAQMLSAAGGEFARLRRPIEINGERIDTIIVRNTPQEYLRAFTSSDAVLKYRDGHFTRHYKKGAKFIDEVHYSGTGADRKILFRKAVAVGPDTPSAQSYVNGLHSNNTNPQIEYQIRDDAKGYVRGSDEWWDIESAKGRVAQKYRGKTLEGFGGVSHFGEGSFIVDPVTSAIRAAQSMGQRMGMRASLTTAKARIEKQFGHLFPEGRIPATIDEIGSKGVVTGKEVGDARAAVAYIRNVEQGYQNLLDMGYKALINDIGNTLGAAGLGRVERAVKSLEEYNPAAFAKQSVFYSYIVLGNPVRQLILQSSTGLGTLIYNPKNWITGQLAKDLADYGRRTFTRTPSEFARFVDEAGILAGVHKHNLVSDALSDVAEHRGNVGSAVHMLAYRAPVEAGFGAGERTAQLLWHSAVFNEMKSKGFDMTDAANIEIASGKIRALTGEMNQAGNMAYSQGTLAIITQFMQVPHKVLLSMLNRKLTGVDKLKFAAANIALYGSVGYGISDLLASDIIPDDPDLRYLVTEGAQAFAYNQFLRAITDDDKLESDFSSFNSLQLDGWVKMFMALSHGDFGKIISAAPAAGLYDPDKGRIAIALKELGRYAGFGVPEGLPPATAQSVLERTLEIASGYSAYAQGHAALKHGQWLDNEGKNVIGTPTEWEARLAQYGVKPKSQREYFQMTQDINASLKEKKEAVLADYKYYNRVLTKASELPRTEVQAYIDANNFYMSRWADDPVAMQIIQQQQKMDLADPESKMFMALLKGAGIESLQSDINRIKMAPLSPENKQILIERITQEFQDK